MITFSRYNRYQAFGRHLLGSLVVALVSAALVFLAWYRWPLMVATGADRIFLVLLAVDVVIGPFITLVIFNPAKKELKFDLAVVLALQIGALFYGIHALYTARPVYLVFASDRFDLVYANDLGEEKLKKVTDDRFRSVPLWGTRVIAAKMPDDAKMRSEILFASLAGGDDLPQLPQFYVPYTDVKTRVQACIQPLDKLQALNQRHVGDIEALAKAYGTVRGNIGFLPLRGKANDLAVIVRKDSAEILAVKNYRPWQD